MLYTHTITFDMSKQENRKRLAVVYGSRETIAIEIILNDRDVPWQLPAGTSCVIRYMKANGNGGVYHSLADGMEAWAVEDNRITIRLSPESLDTPGLLDVSVVAVNNGRTLGIYGFDIHVECNIPTPLTDTDNQLDLTNLYEINTAFAALQMKTDVDDSLTIGGRPADAAATGVVVRQLSAEKLALTGGTMTGPIAMGGNKITGLGWPADDGDAVPFKYVTSVLPQRYEYRERIASKGSWTLELPAVGQYTNLVAVIRPVNPTWTAMYLLCGHYDNYYMTKPIITNESVTVAALDGRNLTVTNGTNYSLEFMVQVITLG